MSLGSVSFRSAAIRVGTAVGLTLSSFFPAAAQQVAAAGQEAPPITLNTDCSKYRPGVLMADTECRIQKGKLLDARGRELDAQGRALDAQLAREKQGLASDQRELAREKQDLACFIKIKSFLKAGKLSRERIIEYGKDRACELAKTLS